MTKVALQEDTTEKTSISKHLVTFKGDDTMMSDDLLEILVVSGFVSVKRDFWRSWTGLRYLNGEEYHGPVFVMGSNLKYEGTRTCTCNICQPNIDPKLKAN